MNEEIQYGVIGDFLMDAVRLDDLREIAKTRRLNADCFTVPSLRTAYEIISATDSGDRVLIAQEVQQKITAAEVEKAIARAATSLLDAERRIEKLVHGAAVSALRATFDQTIATFAGNATLPALEDRLRANITSVTEKFCRQSDEKDGFSLAELADPIPEEEDPNALFRRRWLCKGSGMFLTSVSGSGKSVFTMQLAYAWALGKPVFGIEPLRPMKIAIFQTEDDQEELKEFRVSMRLGYARIHGWTKDEIKMAESNIRFIDTNGKTNKEFIQRFREVQMRGLYDLVIINPFQGVTGFDISQNALLSDFLRSRKDGIDWVIKDEKLKCGLMIVHHTNKPPSQRDRASFGRDAFAEYVGAGGSEITNWMRAMLAIMPTSHEGVYELIAGKRGKRIGWKQPPMVKTPLPVRFVRHSDWETEQMLFWQDSTGAVEAEKPALFNPKVDAERLARDLANVPRTLTDARKHARELFGQVQRRATASFETLVSNPKEFGLVVKRTGIGTQSIIGTQAGLEILISKLREKQAQKYAL